MKKARVFVAVLMLALVMSGCSMRISSSIDDLISPISPMGDNADIKEAMDAFAVKGYSLKTPNKGNYITAYNFAVNNELNEDATRLSTKYNASDGVEQKDLIEDVIEMFSDTTKFEFRGSPAGDFLECILNDVALNSSNAQVFTKTCTKMQKPIDNQRQSVMGVDTDEESVSLVKFQNAYNLASKMIQTFSEVYDRLINQTGV